MKPQFIHQDRATKKALDAHYRYTVTDMETDTHHWTHVWGAAVDAADGPLFQIYDNVKSAVVKRPTTFTQYYLCEPWEEAQRRVDARRAMSGQELRDHQRRLHNITCQADPHFIAENLSSLQQDAVRRLSPSDKPVYYPTGIGKTPKPSLQEIARRRLDTQRLIEQWLTEGASDEFMDKAEESQPPTD